MTILVLIVCLASSPDDCLEVRPVLPLPLVACIIEGQQVAAEWLEDHPKWFLERWRCEKEARDRRA